ncbi:hypothetical protein [uncultured Lamprocystis sp.]|jgi:hypothetical protein|uniref:hypothetical protein n=1 Tax=uncultured Lamprocystis sp. TaxID=543132 RepID=UPI0025DA72EB|nr:hypothetical protein [uncultured Lamprocystis sp.]
MPTVVIDPDSRSLHQRFALIHAPRRTRARYPEGSVTLTADEAAARAGANAERNLYPAEVYGPSRSSEGQRIYYLLRWLT